MSDLIKKLLVLKEHIKDDYYYHESNQLVDEIIKSVSELEDYVMELGERDV